MKKILANISGILTFFVMFSLVTACKNPIIYNEDGAPISMYGGQLIVRYTNYPADSIIVGYKLSIENTNSQGLNVNFTPSTQLFNYAFSNVTSLNLGEKKDMFLLVNVGGRNKGGDLYVTGNCQDGSPIAEGSIWVTIYGRGDAPANCQNTAKSCGMPGNCQDLTKLNGCQDGYYRNYYCSNNEPKYSTTCTSPCCAPIGGTCKSGNCQVTQSLKSINIKLSNGNSQPRNALVKLYESGTTRIVNSSNITGTGTLYSPNNTVDLYLEYDSRLIILLNSLDLTKTTGTSEIILDSLTTSISNATFLKAYKISVPSTFTFTGIDMKIKYGGLSFSNEQGLIIYRCGSYNDATNRCNENWVKKTTTKDTVNDIAMIELTNFSVYGLGESQDVTTTSTTTTTATTGPTTTVSSSGGGGGGVGTTTVRTTTVTSTVLTTVQCTCGTWENLGCSLSPCTSSEMKQERTCNPAACDSESKCVTDDSCAQDKTSTQPEEQPKVASQLTGMFLGIPTDIAVYAIPISILVVFSVGLIAFRYNDRVKYLFASKSKKGYVFTGKIENPDFVNIKIKDEPRQEIVNQDSDLKKQKVEEARKKAIEEMRKRAFEMDKK